MMQTYILFAILVAAVCTLLTRAAPFLFFSGREIPQVVRYLGLVLPPSVIALLVIYCLKSVDFSAAPHGAPELIAIAVTALLHIWRHNNLLSIGGGTLLYMVLVQMVF